MPKNKQQGHRGRGSEGKGHGSGRNRSGKGGNGRCLRNQEEPMAECTQNMRRERKRLGSGRNNTESK